MYPVFIGELGFDAAWENEKPERKYKGKGVYHDALKKYIETKNLSFTVWNFSANWPPSLFNSKSKFDPNRPGKFYKAWLQACE